MNVHRSIFKAGKDASRIVCDVRKRSLCLLLKLHSLDRNSTRAKFRSRFQSLGKPACPVRRGIAIAYLVILVAVRDEVNYPINMVLARSLKFGCTSAGFNCEFTA